ncbi:hypothetical protein GY45DRAFT_1279144 [Cubamyces sp. BRFM 1775]|nr:hypothetical protein GY45DRAFT_1279144 [Cubamyces sp. BRFM 1775]
MTPSETRLPRYAYGGLVVLRALFALYGTGYIHPDEYFQNGEVVAGSTLGLHSHLTWEWDPVFPCRSIVPVWLTTGIPFSVLQLLLQGRTPTPSLVFVVERLSFLLSSFLLDFCVYHLVQDSTRLPALLLLASSYVVHTYQVRPFSNSLEAVFVALSLLLLKKLFLVETQSPSSKRTPIYTSLLALVSVCGVFTRLTFATFFFPVALEILKWGLRQSRYSLAGFVRLLSLPILVAITAVLGFVYADSLYFHGDLKPSHIELTPLNFLRYNLLPSNLAEHGLHPRWLHLVVNLPMIATPALLYYVLRAEFDIFASRSGDRDKTKPGIVQMMQHTYNRVRWSATSLLSIQPHQEPRFLTPLLVPMVVVAINNACILRAGRSFLMFWIFGNVILATLFGVLHQGGVIPSLFRVHAIINDTSSALNSRNFEVVYWRTYMPPRHLLAVRQEDVNSQRVSIRDLSGASPTTIVDNLLAPVLDTFPHMVLLVTPFHAVKELEAQTRTCLKELNRVFPHLDLDHIGESVQVGWKDGLSLGIFDVDVACLREAMSTDRLREEITAQ